MIFFIKPPFKKELKERKMTKRLFKTELHAHSFPVSRCAHADAVCLTERYVNAGYSTVVLQNHLSRYNFEKRGTMAWEETVSFFLSGYSELKAAAQGKLHILLGAEMRVDETNNDYLVFGLDEKKLMQLGPFFSFSTRKLTDALHELGCLVYQAHPMRYAMTLIDPRWDGIDGMEAYNSHKNHDSHNALALQWAKLNDMPMIGGSDFHDPEGHIGSGILTENVIENMDQLIRILKDGKYEIIRD